MVTLFQSLLGKALPAVRPVDRLGHFHCNVQVSALDGQLETSVGILNEMESNLEEKTIKPCFDCN